VSQDLHDVYAVNLASGGKLKMRATGLLAEGTPDAVFKACVLLHEAARFQQLALEALPTCPAVTRLSSLAEECWCFVEGRDPPRAGEVWGDLLHAREGVDVPTARAILSRLTPQFEAAQKTFAAAVNSSPVLVAIGKTGIVAGQSLPANNKARKELTTLLRQFPGATSFWWMQYRLSEAAGDKKSAWQALAKARQLAPHDPRFAAMSLLVAAWALPRAAAEEHLAGVRGSLDRANAEVCLMYAHAEITLARACPAGEKRVRLTRAREAAEAGRARADTEELRRNLKAVLLLLGELLAGREPTLEVLYLAGMGGVAAMEKPTADVADLLAARVRSVGAERAAA
jgi:hypothetical protein